MLLFSWLLTDSFSYCVQYFLKFFASPLQFDYSILTIYFLISYHVAIGLCNACIYVVMKAEFKSKSRILFSSFQLPVQLLSK